MSEGQINIWIFNMMKQVYLKNIGLTLKNPMLMLIVSVVPFTDSEKCWLRPMCIQETKIDDTFSEV